MNRTAVNLLRLVLLAVVVLLAYRIGHLAGYEKALGQAAAIYRDGLADGYDEATLDWREYGAPTQTLDTI